MLTPTLNALPKGTSLVATRVGETFAFYLDIALIGGVIIAAPYVLFQVWRFIAPGLHAHERRLAVPFLLMAIAGTVAGALFTHYVLFPSTIEFFAQFDSTSIKLTPKLEDTFGLYRSMMLGMVAVFQLPTLVFFLSLMRVVTARWLVRHIQYAILASFVVAALLTASTDPWNQTIMAAPMIALYLVSIVVAWLVGLRAERRCRCRRREETAPRRRRATMADQIGGSVGRVLFGPGGYAEIGRSKRTGPTRASRDSGAGASIGSS